MTSVAVLVAMVKLVVRMVDLISQMSGLTSALFRHDVSHTNCTTDRFQQWDSTASVASTAPASSVQAGSVIRHVSCNSV